MINSSDASIRDLFANLLERASEPYFKILKKWIFKGILEDPFEEFIVKENTTCKKEDIERDLNDRYWQERFTYRDEMVPIFLSKYREKILHAGKYLHVIRECGRHDIQNPYEAELGAKCPAGFSFKHKVFVKVRDPEASADVSMASN